MSQGKDLEMDLSGSWGKLHLKMECQQFQTEVYKACDIQHQQRVASRGEVTQGKPHPYWEWGWEDLPVRGNANTQLTSVSVLEFLVNMQHFISLQRQPGKEAPWDLERKLMQERGFWECEQFDRAQVNGILFWPEEGPGNKHKR